MAEIRQISGEGEKAEIARRILEALPEWFGIPEAREEYIRGSSGMPFFAAFEQKAPVGFLYLSQTGKDTVELAVICVRREYHRQGIGRALVAAAKKDALQRGYSFLQVKTVQMGRYEDYDKTNLFYGALGFKEFEVFPTLWGERNPCQIYVMALK